MRCPSGRANPARGAMMISVGGSEGFNPYSIALRKRGSHSARPTPSVTPITAILDTSRSTYSFKVELIWLPMFSTHSTERIRRQPLGTFGMKIESRSEQSYCMCCYSKKHCLMRCPVWMGGEESVDEADLERYEQTKGYAD
jgi:hypothetical protein